MLTPRPPIPQLSQHPGIIHMAASDIFQSIESTTTRDYLIRCSFIEIYNEEVRDLLASSSPLEIREHPKKGVYVDAKETIVGTFEQLLNVLTQGERHRAVAATGMNDRSSRSHTIFRITLESRLTDEEQERISQLIESEQENKTPAEGEVGPGEKKKDECVRVSTLNLVDLAGSESVRLTGASGERQKEGGKINQVRKARLFKNRKLCTSLTLAPPPHPPHHSHSLPYPG